MILTVAMVDVLVCIAVSTVVNILSSTPTPIATPTTPPRPLLLLLQLFLCTLLLLLPPLLLLRQPQYLLFVTSLTVEASRPPKPLNPNPSALNLQRLA